MTAGTALPTSATIHEAAGRIGALPSAIKPVHPSMHVRVPLARSGCVVGGDRLTWDPMRLAVAANARRADGHVRA